MPTWPAVLTALLRGEALPADDAAWAMDEIMNGEATPSQIAGFAVALRAKGETPDEVSGLVRAMLALVHLPGPDWLTDPMNYQVRTYDPHLEWSVRIDNQCSTGRPAPLIAELPAGITGS